MTRTTSLISTTSLCLTLGTTSIFVWYAVRRREEKRRRKECCTAQLSAHEALIGSTPLVHLGKISDLVGRHIWVKMESMNSSATGKDRAALGMINQAEREGLLPSTVVLSSLSSLELSIEQGILNSSAGGDESGIDVKDLEDPMEKIIQQAYNKSRSGGIVVEGTSGSTGIALATLAAARGHACLVVMPDDQAAEKQAILRALGAIVYVVPTAAISNPQHYVNIARRLAERARSKGIQAAFMNQFENEANFDMHYHTTGPELWQQFHAKASNLSSKWCRILLSKPHLSAFIMSAGTGGTISGIGKYLKEQSHDECQIVLVDPPGSSLYHKITHGVAFAPQQREQMLQRHRYDTIAEGIGLDRVTHNLSLGLDYVDEAIQVSDQEAVDMAHFLLQTEGLWVGSSSAMNVVGAIRMAVQLDPGSHLITIICDSGSRHATRLWNRDFIIGRGLSWPGDSVGSAKDGLGKTGQRVPECILACMA